MWWRINSGAGFEVCTVRTDCLSFLWRRDLDAFRLLSPTSTQDEKSVGKCCSPPSWILKAEMREYLTTDYKMPVKAISAHFMRSVVKGWCGRHRGLRKGRLPSLENTMILFKITFCTSLPPFASVPPPRGRADTLGNIVVTWFVTMLRSIGQDAGPSSLSSTALCRIMSWDTGSVWAV